MNKKQKKGTQNINAVDAEKKMFTDYIFSYKKLKQIHIMSTKHANAKQ